MKTVAQFVSEHSLFKGMKPDQVDFIASCGQLRRFAEGDYLTRENDPADFFYLLLEGHAVIETHQHNQPPVPLLSLTDNDIIGWSWLIPPYRYQFDARALSRLRTVRLDGRCIRAKCDTDPALGFELLKRLAAVLVQRIHGARFQLLDVYSADPAPLCRPGESLR
ncbi:cyclic nucleotide-binding domain-containing protein [Aestuariicella hydrocarbonica]|uniref:Cyclic nucleotide-binding domain-containing protein n=1 Tax=Pseudomaricurvus hydrocarbonicus TaxID=1470433 RepID=A0A9E5MN60_9GAMM|nr:cyclic nucleotide-binding domain-containing protein [Aestuariicella hydrocarbonica]NHO67298.1 cyclic nucleotide-binding domain-containing protein [Aestuariicella hydrocarbonica]